MQISTLAVILCFCYYFFLYRYQMFFHCVVCLILSRVIIRMFTLFATTTAVCVRLLSRCMCEM